MPTFVFLKTTKTIVHDLPRLGSEGLHLIDLDKTKICADTEALVEYNRLRQKYRPHLPQFTIVKPFKVSKVPEAKKQPLKRDTTTTIGTDKPPKKSKSSALKDNRRSGSASSVKAEPTNADSKKKANTKRLNTEKVKSLIPPKKTRIETAVNQEYRSGIGPGRRGLINTDGSACYANAAMQCLFAMQRNLFDVLSLMHGPLAEELKRLATSSLKTYETMAVQLPKQRSTIIVRILVSPIPTARRRKSIQ